MQEYFRFPLTFRLRAPGALDVGARTVVPTVEEQHPRPEINRLIETSREVVIEAVEQQLLDARIARGVVQGLTRGAVFGAEGLGHAFRRQAISADWMRGNYSSRSEGCTEEKGQRTECS